MTVSASRRDAVHDSLSDRYAVLGNPVAHSQSPFIHAEFARQTGEPIEYGRIECPLDGFQASVQAFIASADAAAGRGPARGCNITVPFKFLAIPLARRVSERAALAQAANVLRFDDDGWFADNTDGIGLVRDVQQGAGVALAGLRVLLVGAGGAASGVLGPLIAAAPRAITVANRTPARAVELARRHQPLADQHGVTLRATGLDDCGETYDVLLNSSASSLGGAAVPVSPRTLAPDALALDMMYGPAAAPFLAWADAHGARGRDGLGMLVEQAAEAFFVWRGVRPDAAAALAALRARLAGPR
ncbi:shikimate dehydrogenase [Aquabacterium sp.]|uniref:shikimate dehydrogenase n=1 Tax=Aquabacterium sp. TaxID=1872578 RepID=UPI002C7EC9EF|nr:shikimate dehydrogenase [Aquabacterium sp.]HSW08195.1 shikimate dehydrogenase [Aquabacterium sp.]